MSKLDPSDLGKRSFRSRLFNRSTVASFIAGAAAAAALGVSAQGAVAGWHHGSVMDGTHSAAEVDAHVDHMLKHVYAEIDATDAQKTQIGPLVKQAVTDLLPLRAQAHAAHQRALDTLSQTTLDRGALEAARVEHLQLIDQASKRLVQLTGDVGEVLTPAQRKAFSDHLQQMHAMNRM